jgi:hypothetical protein
MKISKKIPNLVFGSDSSKKNKILDPNYFWFFEKNKPKP